MSVEIPSERVPPIAKEIAAAKSTWSIVFWFIAALFGVFAFAAEPSAGEDHSGSMAGFAFWLVVFFWLGYRQHRLARRAKQAAGRATAGTDTFMLAGRELLAYDAAGIPQPGASIKLSNSQVAMLTALPKAELIQKS